jgi:hypothetical protein
MLKPRPPPLDGERLCDCDCGWREEGVEEGVEGQGCGEAYARRRRERANTGKARLAAVPPRVSESTSCNDTLVFVFMLEIELLNNGARDCVGTIYNVANVVGDKMRRVGGNVVLCRHK